VPDVTLYPCAGRDPPELNNPTQSDEFEAVPLRILEPVKTIRRFRLSPVLVKVIGLLAKTASISPKYAAAVVELILKSPTVRLAAPLAELPNAS
jgi:hypothetical protein